MSEINIPIPNQTESQKFYNEMYRSLVSIGTLTNQHETYLTVLKNKFFSGDGEYFQLKEQVKDHEQFINTIKFWLRTVSIALVLQTITFGVAAVVYFVRLYPLLERISKQIP